MAKEKTEDTVERALGTGASGDINDQELQAPAFDQPLENTPSSTEPAGPVTTPEEPTDG